MTSRTLQDRIRSASSFDELVAVVAEAGEEMTAWYDAVEGDYSDVPTWGPEVDVVTDRILMSCHERDLVSWDSTGPTIRLLVRRARLDGTHEFYEEEADR